MFQEQKLYDDLKKIPHFDVFWKENVTDELHFSKSSRIAPIVVVANEGYTLASTANYAPLKGNHGFDNSLCSMRTIFMGQLKTKVIWLEWFATT